ncbi:aspartate dehydrogenase [Neisseriaceae bacterium TC5R-5]|nr:aspartate dehydrogenase [Neisseriaceae bacterium TC5R-5]
MQKIMLIGYGAMAQAVIQHLPAKRLGWIVARPHHHAAIQQRFGGQVAALTHPLACDGHPALVVECASQQAIADFATEILTQGWSLALISVGALANAALQQKLQQATRQPGQLQLLAGAVAGLEALRAARHGGLEQVSYQASKPPAAWRGSLAEQWLPLDQLSCAQTFFEGSAREAAQRFPANANVAASIALAGLGLDRTRVSLQADPGLQRNRHTIHAHGQFGDFTIQLNGNPLPGNPKTSLLAALSVVEACRQLWLDESQDIAKES